MPQIAQLAETFSSQVFWVLVIFGLVFFVIGRGMVPRVMDTVSLRDRQIADDLAAAQAARDHANKQEEAWRTRENENRAQAQALVNEARASAAEEAEGKLQTAQRAIDARLSEAEQSIAAARAAAAQEIERIASDAAQDIVERLAGIAVPSDRADAAVKEALTHG
jgi:F-type H+-transporting ATPase subunit b